MTTSCRLLPVLSLAVWFLVGCGSATSTPDLGEWTLNEEGLSLTEDMQVSETEAFYFGEIINLDVTSDGEIVVADSDASNIKVLRPDATLIDTLGREGEGPGEFQRLRQVQVARGDSIYAFDAVRSRLTVYAPAPSLERARIVTIPQQEGSASDLRVLEDGMIARFGSGFSAEDGVYRPSPDVWRRVDESGLPGDTLVKARERLMAMSDVSGGGFVISVIPFSPQTMTAVGPDSRLYQGWTDSLRIEAHSMTGEPEVVASVPAEPVPFQGVDRDSALSPVPAEMQSMVESALPETKPAFTDLVVADDGRLWVERPAAGPTAETVDWWVLDPEAQTIDVVELPSEVDIEVVQNGNVYGSTTTEIGAPAVVRYRIDRAV